MVTLELGVKGEVASTANRLGSFVSPKNEFSNKYGILLAYPIFRPTMTRPFIQKAEGAITYSGRMNLTNQEEAWGVGRNPEVGPNSHTLTSQDLRKSSN